MSIAAPLRDGRVIRVRFIQPEDAPRLRAFFQELSAGSIYLRFSSPRRELSWPEAVRLATVDG